MKHIIYNNRQKVLELYHSGMPPSEICREYRIPSSTLFYWINKYPKAACAVDKGERNLTSWSRLVSHHKKIEAELAFLKRTILKDYSTRDKLKLVDKEYGKEGLNVQCDALGLSRGTYLNHRLRNKNDNAWFKKREAEYLGIISQIYEESGRVYGARKITKIMQKSGKPVSEKYVRRLMCEAGLSNRWSETKDRHYIARHLREAAHSSQEFKVTGINQVWVSDTSEVLVNGRYYHVRIYLDLFSRKVVGWRIGKNGSTQLVKRTFLEAYKARGNPKSLIVHTDNGSCYSSFSFNQMLQKLKLVHSYSRVHIPHDNAVAESFFNILKREGIYLNGYPRSLNELRKQLTRFIARYNSSRPHEHLGYVSPEEYEKTMKTA